VARALSADARYLWFYFCPTKFGSDV